MLRLYSKSDIILQIFFRRLFMKSIVKKMAFILTIITVLSCCVIFSGAASEYKLSISSRSMNVGLNQYTQVDAVVEGLELQPEITWSTSDETIATVSSSGRVKGLALGNFEIIATTVVADKTLTAKFPMKVVNKENVVDSYMEVYNLLSFQYSYDYCGYYYANDKGSWQKEFGFAGVYDLMAPYVQMDYDSSRIYFTYDDQDFMIQLWKGQYVLFHGCEIGIYHRDADGLKKDLYTLYNAANEKYWLTMDMGLYRQMNEGDPDEDYQLLFRRPVDKYWWCTGFVQGWLRDTQPSDELRMEATITFKDIAMASAFAQALNENGFISADSKDAIGIDGYYQNGADVSFSWQNITEPEVEKDWKNIGIFLLTMMVVMFVKVGLPELTKLLVK